MISTHAAFLLEVLYFSQGFFSFYIIDYPFFIGYLKHGKTQVYEVFIPVSLRHQLLLIFIEYLLWAEQHIKCFCIQYLIFSFTKTLQGRYYYHTCFISEEFVAQSSWILGHTESQGAMESVFETRQVDSQTCPLSCCAVTSHHTHTHTAPHTYHTHTYSKPCTYIHYPPTPHPLPHAHKLPGISATISTSQKFTATSGNSGLAEKYLLK